MKKNEKNHSKWTIIIIISPSSTSGPDFPCFSGQVSNLFLRLLASSCAAASSTHSCPISATNLHVMLFLHLKQPLLPLLFIYTRTSHAEMLKCLQRTLNTLTHINTFVHLCCSYFHTRNSHRLLLHLKHCQMPKAQRTRGLSSSYQSYLCRSYHKFKHKSHQISFSDYSPSINFKFSTKQQHHDLT